MADEILTETSEAVGVVRINRPEVLNALNLATLKALVAALERFDGDAGIRCLLISGSERAFGSGMDVAELAEASVVEVYHRDVFHTWEQLRRIRKPIVAAVSGYAVSGACELMLAADIVVVAETARIALPQVGMGSIPGGGGTQRLTRAIGKAQAMDVVLTGRTITAREALAMGLISRIVPREHYFTAALEICRELCKRPPLALQMAKEAVLKAYETTLPAGLEYERNLHYLLFATADQREGMRAFLEKRPAVFVGR